MIFSTKDTERERESMESNKKQAGQSASSSFTAELFGANESVQDQQSKGLFASIFPPPSKACYVFGVSIFFYSVHGSYTCSSVLVL